MNLFLWGTHIKLSQRLQVLSCDWKLLQLRTFPKRELLEVSLEVRKVIERVPYLN